MVMNEMSTQIVALLEAIAEIVRAPKPYREKVEAILAQADEDDRANLGEFIAWFDNVDLQ
jgi:hypothetical protein